MEKARPLLMLTTHKSCQKHGRLRIDQDRLTHAIPKIKQKFLIHPNNKVTKNHTS